MRRGGCPRTWGALGHSERRWHSTIFGSGCRTCEWVCSQSMALFLSLKSYPNGSKGTYRCDNWSDNSLPVKSRQVKRNSWLSRREAQKSGSSESALVHLEAPEEEWWGIIIGNVRRRMVKTVGVLAGFVVFIRKKKMSTEFRNMDFWKNSPDVAQAPLKFHNTPAAARSLTWRISGQLRALWSKKVPGANGWLLTYQMDGLNWILPTSSPIQ